MGNGQGDSHTGARYEVRVVMVTACVVNMPAHGDVTGRQVDV
jgi:hypothetical protein